MSSRDTCIWEMPEPAGDLGLGQSLEEPQVHHLPLARRQLAQQRVQGGPLLRPGQLGVLLAEPLAQGLGRIGLGAGASRDANR